MISGRPSHPGQILVEFINNIKGLTVDKLSDVTEIEERYLLELMIEKESMTPYVAQVFSRVFSTTPSYWIDLQSKLDLWENHVKHEQFLSGLESLVDTNIEQ